MHRANPGGGKVDCPTMSSKAKTLVTGGAGFIGGHVTAMLLEEGRSVRALLRPGEALTNLQGLEGDLETMTGDVRDADAMAKAMQGCDRVYHLAAIYALWMADRSLIWDVNVRGTQVVCQAALDAGVERMVYTSSIAALGILPGEQPADETTPYNYWTANDYIFSKYVSELECREYIRRGLPAVIVNPALPFGWGDTGPTPTGNVVLSLMNGKFPGYIDGGVNVVDVRDVARGHLLADEKGTIGERYILGGHNVTTREFMELVGRVCKVKVPRRRLPTSVMMRIGRLLEGVADRVTHSEPFITEKSVEYASRHVYFDTTKAREELGLPKTAIEESIGESARWFRHRGLAK